MRAVHGAKAALLVACVASVAGAIPGLVRADTDPTAQMLAHRLVDDAFGQSRDPAVSPETAAQESAILLQAASRLDPDNLLTWKLLAEAAAATKQPELQREALRKIIKLDPGDLVAQVKYLDFLASGKQALDERAKVYEAALLSKTLNPQIRSRMAVRLADIATERGDGASVRSYLKQALQLDDLNIPALREVVQLSSRSPQGHLSALVLLLTANPFQPDAWISCARVLAGATLHSQAADVLIVSIEQMQLAGTRIPADIYLDLGIELTAAGRFVEAHPIFANLSEIKDAPLSSLVAYRMLLTEYTPPVFAPVTHATTVPDMGPLASTNPATGPATSSQPATQAADPQAFLPVLPDATTAPTADAAPAPAAAPAPDTAPAAATESTADKLSKTIRAQLGASIEKNPNSAALLEQALWIEYSVLPDANPKTGKWLKHYGELVPADDATLARLHGWALLREGKLDEAKAILEKRSAADPLAELGLARVLIAQGKLEEEGAAKIQDIWSSHPTGLLALEVVQTVRQTKIRLTETSLSREIGGILQELPPGSMTAHRSPREMQLVTGALEKAHVNLGEPVMMRVRITNSSGRALPVGEDGAIKTRVGLLGRSRGTGAENLGLFMVVDLQRVYRMEPQDEISANIRVDCGALSDLLMSNALREYTVALKILTVPRGLADSPAAGLGGQEINIDDVDRAATRPRFTQEEADRLAKEPRALAQADELKHFTDDMIAAKGVDQLELMQINSSILSMIPEEVGAPDPARALGTEVRGKVIGGLLLMCSSPSAVTRAYLVRSLSMFGLGDSLMDAEAKLMEDPDLVVRMQWVWKLYNLAVKNIDARQTMIHGMEKMRREEKDPLGKAWVEVLVKDMTDQIAAQSAERAMPAPAPVDTTPKPAPVDTTAPRLPPTLIPNQDPNQ